MSASSIKRISLHLSGISGWARHAQPISQNFEFEGILKEIAAEIRPNEVALRLSAHEDEEIFERDLLERQWDELISEYFKKQ